MISRYQYPIGPQFSRIHLDIEMKLIGQVKQPIILGLTGPTKSGKTLIAKHLVTEWGFLYKCMSAPLRLATTNLAENTTYKNLGDYARLMREYKGEGFLAEEILFEIDNLYENHNIVIDGIYHPKEIDVFKKKKSFSLWAILCEKEIRKQEVIKWYGLNSDEDNIEDRDIFENLNNYASDKFSPNLKRCIEMCDEKIEINKFDQENIIKKTEKALKQLFIKQKT